MIKAKLFKHANTLSEKFVSWKKHIVSIHTLDKGRNTFSRVIKRNKRKRDGKNRFLTIASGSLFDRWQQSGKARMRPSLPTVSDNKVSVSDDSVWDTHRGRTVKREDEERKRERTTPQKSSRERPFRPDEEALAGSRST